MGRGRTLADPAALGPNTILSGTTGPVLDPIFSLRRRFRIEPGGSAMVGFTLAVADVLSCFRPATRSTEAAQWPERSNWPGPAARLSMGIVTRRPKITSTNAWRRT